MGTRAALLDAIAAADPDDPVPRLVFADFLDEEGEPERAEFVRLCCQSHARPGDAAVAARAQALFDAHGSRWLAGVYEAVGQPLPPQLARRGWLGRAVDRLSPPPRYARPTVAAGALVVNTPPLGLEQRPLHLLFLRFGLVSGALCDAAAARPAALATALADHPVGHLEVGLPSDLRAWDAVSGSHLCRVRRLDLWLTGSDESLAPVAADPHLTGLTELGLQATNNLVPEQPPFWPVTCLDSLARSPLAGRLRSLSVPPWAGVFDALAGWPADAPLDSLLLHEDPTYSTPPTADQIAGLPLALRLRSLSLRMQAISDDNGERLAAVVWPRLAVLDVAENGLADRTATALGRATGLPALADLDVSTNRITDVGVRALVPLAARLTRLNLGYNGIMDAGADALIAVADGPLVELNLAGSRLSRRCQRRLRSAFGDRFRM